HNGQVRLVLVEHVDGAREIFWAQPRTDVKIAQLSDAQSLEIRMKIGDRKIHFLHVELRSFYNGAKSGDGEGGSHSDGACRMYELPPPFGVANRTTRREGTKAQKDEKGGDRNHPP